MAEKLTIGIIYGSDTAHLPERSEEFAGLSLDMRGHNDAPRLIDARAADVVPLLMTPEYLSRSWRYDFSRFDVIFNSLADPDLNATTLLVAISALAGVSTPIVNDPRNVIRTRRDIVAGMLQGLEGLVVPKTARLMPGETASSVVADRSMSYPILLRGAGSHTGVGLVKVANAAELDAAIDSGAVAPPAYLTEYVDCRGADGLHRKMRLMVCGATVVMRHHLFSDHWMVNAASQKFMEDRPDLLEFERQAAADPLTLLPQRGAQLMTTIKNRIGLDYFGIDCATLPDGRLVVFEVNAVMNMLPPSRHAIRGPFTLAAIGRVAEDLNTLLRSRAGSAKRKSRPATAGGRRGRNATSSQ
ncbi:MAG: RimK family alpha-L-glutamate ligase [Reyranellaceae bacterium]